MNYYLWISGQEHGPYTLEQIQQSIDEGDINPQQTARTEDGSEWKPISNLAALKRRPPENDAKKATSTTPVSEQPAKPKPPQHTERNFGLLYTNLLLTIIAACLVFQVTRAFTPTPQPVTIQNPSLPVVVQNPAVPESMPATLNVRVVGVTQPMDVNLARVGGDTLSKVGGQVVLPVGVHNTVETKIVGPVFGGAGTGFRDGIGVVILNK